MSDALQHRTRLRTMYVATISYLVRRQCREGFCLVRWFQTLIFQSILLFLRLFMNSTLQFQSDCMAWINASSQAECTCDRTAPAFPSFPRPNATCLAEGGGCALSLECHRSDDNVTFSGHSGCFADRSSQSRKRCGPPLDSGTHEILAPAPVVLATLALLPLI